MSAPPINSRLRPALKTDFDTKHLKNLHFNDKSFNKNRFCPKTEKPLKNRFTGTQYLKMYSVLYLTVGRVNKYYLPVLIIQKYIPYSIGTMQDGTSLNCFVFHLPKKAGFRSRSRGIWLEPEPSLWPGSGSTLNICLIIHENYMELNIIRFLF